MDFLFSFVCSFFFSRCNDSDLNAKMKTILPLWVTKQTPFHLCETSDAFAYVDFLFLFLSGLLKVVLLFQTSVVVPNVSRLSSCFYVHTFLCAREQTYTCDRPEVAGSAQRKWQKRHGYTCRTKPSLSQKKKNNKKNRRFSFSVFIRTLSNICRARHGKQQKTHIHIRTHTETRISVHLFWTQEILNKITSGKSLILKHPAFYLSRLVLANVWRFYCCAKKFASFSFDDFWWSDKDNAKKTPHWSSPDCSCVFSRCKHLLTTKLSGPVRIMRLWKRHYCSHNIF